MFSNFRPPNGCLQYWTTLVGRITTFNWLTTTSSSNLPSQRYQMKIKLHSQTIWLRLVCKKSAYNSSASLIPLRFEIKVFQWYKLFIQLKNIFYIFFNVATSHGRSFLYLALIVHVSYILLMAVVSNVVNTLVIFLTMSFLDSSKTTHARTSCFSRRECARPST